MKINNPGICNNDVKPEEKIRPGDRLLIKECAKCLIGKVHLIYERKIDMEENAKTTQQKASRKPI